MTYTNTNKKAAGASNTNGLHTDTNGANFPTAGTEGKAMATLIAQFAIVGHAVHKDLAELQAFAKQVGVNHG